MMTELGTYVLPSISSKIPYIVYVLNQVNQVNQMNGLEWKRQLRHRLSVLSPCFKSLESLVKRAIF